MEFMEILYKIRLTQQDHAKIDAIFSNLVLEQNHKQFFVPAGFAHGFVVLSESATFFYKVDKFYEPGNEVGIMYNDKDLNIDWKLPSSELIFSEKDKTLGSFAEYAASL